jgi:signal peptidase I
MKDGLLYINGEAVKIEENGIFVETYAPQGPEQSMPACANGPVGPGADCNKEISRETLPNGVSHDILNIGNRSLDNTGIFTVPADNFFFMGDNRDNSTDSRVPQSLNGVGFVPREDIVGRADRVIFSSSGRSMLAFWAWRSDRFFKGIE